MHCSCAVFKQGEISFYIKYWNIVYFKDTPVSLQGFMIVAVVWYVFHQLSLIFYLHLNCHKFWYSSKASDINWTWVREYSINTRGRSIKEKLKALCRLYYSIVFIVLGRVLFLYRSVHLSMRLQFMKHSKSAKSNTKSWLFLYIGRQRSAKSFSLIQQQTWRTWRSE